jgi:hypothetical protein
MNERIARRWAKANSYPELPVRGPSWASTVVDAGDELIAVHRDTGAPYSVELHRDLDAEDAAIVIARRILSTGGSAPEVRRFLDAFELPVWAQTRLKRALEEVAG